MPKEIVIDTIELVNKTPNRDMSKKYKAEFNYGGGSTYVFAGDIVAARAEALAAYRKKGFGCDTHTAEQVIKSVVEVQ